jgi:uncharacterized protein YjbK
MLKTSEFVDRKIGIKKVSEILRSQIEYQSGKYKEDIKEKNRRTWYLDTESYDLNIKKFLFRVRKEEETNEYYVTLKCRHPDRYMSVQHDLSSHVSSTEYKFEEDVLSPFVSNFSLSSEFKFNQKPEFDTVESLEHYFPGIKGLGILSSKRLKKVNNFEAVEIACKIGKVIFNEKNDVKMYLNFWYLPDGKKTPIIIEFTFNYEAKEQKYSDRLEEFSRSLVRECDGFYYSLQKDKIVDLATAKTKTEFAYQYKS